MTLQILLLLIALPVLERGNLNDECGGKGRWRVKTLADKEAKSIDMKPKPTTIAALLLQKDSRIIADSSQRAGIEFNTYEVSCYIRKFKKEDDGDYHLVLADINDKSKTLIGEIPDPDCTLAQTSIYSMRLHEIRKAFESMDKSHKQLKRHIFKVTGVAFFDKEHQKKNKDRAANNLELHPILFIF